MPDLQPGQRVRIDGGSYQRDYGTVSDQDLPRAFDFPTIMVTVEGRYYNPQQVRAEWCTPVPDGMRDGVPGDLLNAEMLKEVFEKPFLGTLWTKGDSGILTPYVCNCSFGDGLKLIKIFTINQRPNYHVVRVDSGWSESNFSAGETIGDHIDDILQGIEEECGRAGKYLDEPCDSCGDTACRCDDDYSADKAFPELDDENGCSWAEVSWPWLMKQLGLRA